jgi:putative restriction endonuclease
MCLNSIHDKTVDKYFVTITSDYKIKVSKYLNEYAITEFFFNYENQSIISLGKFLPSKNFKL